MSETEQHRGWGIFRLILVTGVGLTTTLLLITGILGIVALYQDVEVSWAFWDVMIGGIVLTILCTLLLVFGVKVYQYSHNAKYLSRGKLSAFRPVLGAQIVLVVSSVFLLLYGILRQTLPASVHVTLWPFSVLSELFFYAAVLTVCVAFFLQSKGRAMRASTFKAGDAENLLSEEPEAVGFDPSNYDY